MFNYLGTKYQVERCIREIQRGNVALYASDPFVLYRGLLEIERDYDRKVFSKYPGDESVAGANIQHGISDPERKQAYQVIDPLFFGREIGQSIGFMQFSLCIHRRHLHFASVQFRI